MSIRRRSLTLRCNLGGTIATYRYLSAQEVTVLFFLIYLGQIPADSAASGGTRHPRGLARQGTGTGGGGYLPIQ